jgi:hypothetical protein
VLILLITVSLLLAITAWLLKQALIGRRSAQDPQSGLQMIDAAAFKNLICREDDVFLRKSLRPRHYRIARRARTRAVQQYLMWIAKGCAHVQLILRSQPHEFAEAPERARSLSALAFRLRIASLGLWTSLWLQRVFPQFDLMPTSLAPVYEDLTDNLKLYMGLHPNRPSASAGSVP